jgi:hypothetical protein
MLALETVDLEIEMARLFSSVLMLPEKVGEAVYMTPFGAQTRIDLLRHAAAAVYALRPRQRRDSESGRRKVWAVEQVNDIAAEARKRFDARHRTVHDEWYTATDTRTPKRMRVDGVQRLEGVSITLKEIRAEIRKTRILIDRVTKLADALKRAPPQLPSARASPPQGQRRPTTGGKATASKPYE